MKAIEEERDGLMRGMQMVQRAEDWYKEQLSAVQERMRSLGKTGGGQVTILSNQRSVLRSRDMF